MRTANETRQCAWNLLRAGNDTYGKYLLGMFCLTLAGWAAIILIGASFFVGFFVLQGILDPETIAAAKDIPLLQALKDNDLDAMGKAVQTLWQHPQLLVWAMVLAILPTVVLFYYIGFNSWGSHAMGIACARGGLSDSHAFSGWGNGWKMMRLIFWQQTRVFLWSLLLVVPGIRAMFSYALAPYLQVDHPDWPSWRCLDESARLMEGHRWRLFVLDISFIGWYILVYLAGKYIRYVGGFAQVFLAPYDGTAHALFYEERLDETDAEKRTGDGSAEAELIDKPETDEQERNPEDDEH